MKNQLFYTKKAEHFEEALPIGNGRIGGLVFGNLKKEQIALNEDTLWSGYPKDFNKKDAHEHLADAQQAIFNKDYKKARDIINHDMHGHWSDCYLPFGDLVIEYKGISTKNYKRTLDLETGVAKVEGDGFCETVFVSHPAQLMVVNIHSEKPISFKVKLESRLQHSVKSIEDSLVISGNAPEICMPNYYNKGESIIQGTKGMSFAGAVKVLGNATFNNDYIGVDNQTDTILLISLATGYIDFKTMPENNCDYAIEKALSRLSELKSYDVLLNEHCDDFSALFNRVSFTLEGGYEDLPTDKRIKQMNKTGDDYSLVALLFQFGRYLTISGSRKGTMAMNLQGIWNTHVRAPWSSNYTININTQMNYWCTDSSNLSECFEPLIDFVKKLDYMGKKTAKAYYNANGFCSHHNSDIWGMTYPATAPDGSGDSTQWAPWSISSPWLLNQLYEHYLYTKDEEYKKDLTELFSHCLDFYKDFLIEHNGELVTCPSISPENTFKDNGVETAITYMPAMDREILYEFFTNCRELGLDAPEIEQVKPASDGRIPEWAEEFKETHVEHRHISHLYCIYPSRLIESEELQKACEKSLEVRGFGGTGWSLGWKVCVWARLCNAENAFRLIKQQLTYISPKKRRGEQGGSYPNLFDAHPPFQIDGNFGVTAGIAEMLKNRAIPESWSGEIIGLKGYGGETISFKFKNGIEID